MVSWVTSIFVLHRCRIHTCSSTTYLSPLKIFSRHQLLFCIDRLKNQKMPLLHKALPSFFTWLCIWTSLPTPASSTNDTSALIPAHEHGHDATVTGPIQDPGLIRGVKRMSGDEGEKFFWEYWYIDNDNDDGVVVSNDTKTETTATEQPEHITTDLGQNEPQFHLQARTYPYQPPSLALALELELELAHPQNQSLAQPQQQHHQKRDFKCPSDTTSCAVVNWPDFCCRKGDVCELIQDVDGSRRVGCCPAGRYCHYNGVVVGGCREGYTSCPESVGGGCCMEGFECVVGGCEYNIVRLFVQFEAR